MNEQTCSFCVVCVSANDSRVLARPFWGVHDSKRIDSIAVVVAEAAEKFGCGLHVRVVEIAE